VYDLPLTEAIVRLTNPGDTTLDIGANIGYMSFVLSQSAGPAGRVLSFEPNPSILPTLRSNVSSWKSLHGAPIQIEAVALSDRDGDGVLGFPVEYASNNGVASLELDTDGVPVSLRRLDSVVGRAGVMKVDVEGHETAVFSGAEKLLARKLIRDILFEEHDTYPATSHKILLGYGYHLFRVTRSLWRPLLLPPEEPARQTDFPSNYLATKEPARARFAGWGWKALSTKCGSFPPAG
jgi:FkbM family methyltransferase